MLLQILIYSYFVLGIGGSVSSLFLQKFTGPSALFLHGKAAGHKVVKVNNNNNNNNNLSHNPITIQYISSFVISKHYFWHFYALGFLSCCIFSLFPSSNSHSRLVTTLLAIQCSRRLVECFTVMPGAEGSKMHLIHYLIGISYYPVLLLSFQYQNTSSLPNTNTFFWLFLFGSASVLQFYCHLILGQERVRIKGSHGPIDNFIFKFIHTPHYTAELLIYTCICALQGFHPLGLLNLIWIIAILGISSFNSANWMCKTWNYKSNREFCKYLFIPFLF